jgi:hypothetical protein
MRCIDRIETGKTAGDCSQDLSTHTTKDALLKIAPHLRRSRPKKNSKHLAKHAIPPVVDPKDPTSSMPATVWAEQCWPVLHKQPPGAWVNSYPQTVTFPRLHIMHGLVPIE